MASSFADRPILPPGDADGQNDPFVSPAPAATGHHRYSNFDSQLFALGPASSPGQAKRALEAHLTETERRMEEAGKLGTALVQQQKELTERLREVEKLQSEGQLTPELRSKLTEIEKEYNDVARETARAFLPKQRVPSNETGGGSPYVPEGRGGRRSVSPSKFESQATGSPTKLSVPNRKIRNQPSNRVHDIEFAAEISTSLLAQVRNLQSLLAEKDEELRDIKTEKSRLEIETEGFQQRVKTLDESEHRYKDENWNLETQIHELIANQKEGADREKKQSQTLNVLQAEKNQTQKELDEVKDSLSKLAEEHEASVKHHDIELGTAKRNAVLAETERTALQRKIDDLTSQNQELAKAFSSQRGRALEREQNVGVSDEDFETAADNATPEHSPPPSPIKGTPRHSVLESETLKTSLLHAQRTIQSQRNQVHREKTEKLELKRMLQETRDELEKLRNDSTGVSNRRSRKVESKEFKKPSKGLLGGLRSSRSEVFVEDPEWEEHQGHASPRSSPTHSTPVARQFTPGEYPATTDTSDHNETSDAAFETANERGTETEDFQTGAEEFSGSDDAETETESLSKGRSRRPPNLNIAGNRSSFHSTASTSGDEDVDFSELKTPIAQTQQNMRLKAARSFLGRRSRQASEEPAFQSSPASFANSSNSGTPQPAGQSLFAELAELEGSDDESLDATPSRRARSLTPASTVKSHTTSTPSLPRLPTMSTVDDGEMTDPIKRDARAAVSPRVVMVDCGVMTEPIEPPIPQTPSTVVDAERPTSTGSIVRVSQSPAEEDTESNSTRALEQADTVQGTDSDVELAQFPVPPSAAVEHSPPSLAFSEIDELIIDPVEEPGPAAPVAPALTFTSVESQDIEPRIETPYVPPLPVLAFTPVMSELVEPVAEPEVTPAQPPVPELAMSAITSEVIEPQAELEVALPLPPALTLSPLSNHVIDPLAEPEVLPSVPELVFSPLVSEQVLPQPERKRMPAPLGLSTISSWDVQPRLDPAPVLPSLTLSSVVSEQVEPVRLPTPEALAPRYTFSSIDSIETRPVSPRSPKRNGFIFPSDRDLASTTDDEPRTPNTGGLFGSLLKRNKGRDFSDPIIAEDETRQSPSDSRQPETPESQRPFKEISSNADARPARRPSVPMSDHGAQTSLTAEAIDQIFKVRAHGHEKSQSIGSSIGTPGTVRIRRFSQDQETPGSPTEKSAEPRLETTPFRRPGSASSSRPPTQPLPPLPANHKQVIEAARSNSSQGPSGNATVMGPPLWPASAMRNQRPRTPSIARPQSPASAKGTPTPRAARAGSAAAGAVGGVAGTATVQSPTKASARSRRSSVSSFTSEIENRFNIQENGLGMDPTGFGPNTDPRMIQAITQTMIGEYLWKYTRKAGRGDMSENRHRRYFWVHPYTRTLYWSDRDPSTASRSASKAKSVPIEAVRVVTDDNPMPPGLHRKSLIVISPGRAVKFTCTTGQRHETWFNALSYLLLRTNDESQSDAEELAGNITQADVDEFNPQLGGQRSANAERPRAPPSLSSYNSRTTRNQSPAIDASMDIPTLTPTPHKNGSAQRPSIGTLSRISGYWKNSQVLSGTFSSLRSRSTSGQQGNSIYEASEVHDSAEDVREIIERQDREADRLENVRACCDGKHDVGTLHQHLKRARPSHTHSHSGASASTPMSTTKSRA